MLLLALGCAPEPDAPSRAVPVDTAREEDTAQDTGEPDDSGADDTSETGQGDTGPVDDDGDGWPAGEDCDDADPDVQPGAEDVCGNGKDDDCDGDGTICRRAGDYVLSDAALAVYGERDNDQVGLAGLFVPDVDGDGDDELVLGYRTSWGAGYLGGLAVLLGGRTEGGLVSEADATVSSTAYGGFGDLLDWGDFDEDGVAELLTDFDGGQLGYLDVPTAGAVELLDYFHEIDAEFEDFASWPFAWRSLGDGGGAALGASGTVRGHLEYPAFRLFLPPVEEVSWEDADVSVFNDERFTEARYALDVGDLDGDGVSTIAVVVIVVWRDESTLTGAVQRFDAVPPDGATLSDADGTVWGEPAPHDYGGLLVRPGGDFDGDGYDDLLLVDQAADYATSSYAGCAHVFPGPLGPEAELADAPTIICGTDYRDRFATYADGRGDVDADGRADLLGGEYDNAKPYHGAVRLFYGPLPAGRSESLEADATVRGESTYDSAVVPVAGGDFDGDGVGDFVVGAYAHMGSAYNGGAAFLFDGWGP